MRARRPGRRSPGLLQSWQDREHWTGEICLDENDPSTCSPQPYHEDLGGETYSYDKVGNRTDHGAVVQTGNRLTQYDGYTLEYDDDGNLTRKSRPGFEQTFTWSAPGELTSVTTDGVTTTYGYDALGRRVRKTAATGTTTRYLWDGDDLAMELGPGNAILREYSYYPGIDQPHAVRIPAEQDRIYYYLPELPGHVAGLTSEDYRVANVYRYTPFGEPIETGLAEWATQPLGFGSRERDAESGMYYVRARYYDPELGRFISEDPIGLEGGINMQVYAGNDPVNLTDPFGLRACPEGVVCLHRVTGYGLNLQSLLSRLRVATKSTGPSRGESGVVTLTVFPDGLGGGDSVTTEMIDPCYQAISDAVVTAGGDIGIFLGVGVAAELGRLSKFYRAIGNMRYYNDVTGGGKYIALANEARRAQGVVRATVATDWVAGAGLTASTADGSAASFFGSLMDPETNFWDFVPGPATLRAVSRARVTCAG